MSHTTLLIEEKKEEQEQQQQQHQQQQPQQQLHLCKRLCTFIEECVFFVSGGKKLNVDFEMFQPRQHSHLVCVFYLNVCFLSMRVTY